MSKTISLQPGDYYHINKHGNNQENIFLEEKYGFVDDFRLAALKQRLELIDSPQRHGERGGNWGDKISFLITFD